MLKEKIKSKKGITGVDITATVIILSITIVVAFNMLKHINELNIQMYYNNRKNEIRQVLLREIEEQGIEKALPNITFPYKYEEQNTKVSINIKSVETQEDNILKIIIDDKDYYIPIKKGGKREVVKGKRRKELIKERYYKMVGLDKSNYHSIWEVNENEYMDFCKVVKEASFKYKVENIDEIEELEKNIYYGSDFPTFLMMNKRDAYNGELNNKDETYVYVPRITYPNDINNIKELTDIIKTVMEHIYSNSDIQTFKNILNSQYLGKTPHTKIRICTLDENDKPTKIRGVYNSGDVEFDSENYLIPKKDKDARDRNIMINNSDYQTLSNTEQTKFLYYKRIAEIYDTEKRGAWIKKDVVKEMVGVYMLASKYRMYRDIEKGYSAGAAGYIAKGLVYYYINK